MTLRRVGIAIAVLLFILALTEFANAYLAQQARVREETEMDKIHAFDKWQFDFDRQMLTAIENVADKEDRAKLSHEYELHPPD